MKTSKSKKLQELLDSYYQTNEIQKELEREKKRIREEIIAQMKESAISCGEYVALLKDRERESIDKKKLIQDHGREFLEDYLKTTQYQQLEVTKAS